MDTTQQQRGRGGLQLRKRLLDHGFMSGAVAAAAAAAATRQPALYLALGRGVPSFRFGPDSHLPARRVATPVAWTGCCRRQTADLSRTPYSSARTAASVCATGAQGERTGRQRIYAAPSGARPCEPKSRARGVWGGGGREGGMGQSRCHQRGRRGAGPTHRHTWPAARAPHLQQAAAALHEDRHQQRRRQRVALARRGRSAGRRCISGRRCAPPRVLHALALPETRGAAHPKRLSPSVPANTRQTTYLSVS